MKHEEAEKEKEVKDKKEAGDGKAERTDERKRGRWLKLGFLICLILSAALFSLVLLIRNNHTQVKVDRIETEGNVYWLFGSNPVLYRELAQKISGSRISYGDLYLEELAEARDYDPALHNGMNETEYKLWIQELIQGEKSELENAMKSQAVDFAQSGQFYDYGIRDTETGTVYSNVSGGIMPQIKNYGFYISFHYDANGNVRVGDAMAGSNVENLRRYANMAILRGETEYEYYWQGEELADYLRKSSPKSCEIVYAMDSDTMSRIAEGGEEFRETRYDSGLYADSGSVSQSELVLLWGAALLIPFLLSLLLPQRQLGKGYEDSRACRISLEFMGIWGIVFLAGAQLTLIFSVYVASGSLSALIGKYTGAPQVIADLIAGSGCLGAITLTGLVAWYLGICLRPVRELGVWAYFKQRCLIYRIIPFTKKSLKSFYDSFVQMNLEKHVNRKLVQLAAVNFVILVLGSLLFGAWNEFILLLIFLYSGAIYLLLRKYMKDLRHKYGVLMNAVDQMAQGNLNADMAEDMGILEPLRPKLVQIQTGFRQAVEEEVKSQRMKAELITNVSHDLKTPLTAIITYIGLLREKGITQEQREEYMDTLERKSLRLKLLIEDLFEVSKASTGNVTLHRMKVDLMNLVKQAHAEAERMLVEKGLEIRMRLPEEKLILVLDSQKAYRIYENLFNNVAKYAMKGTRVYVDGGVEKDWLYVSIKNISEQELVLSAEELSDRFIRGDASRNTEGSGLGLAIAKSFTQLMGGKFEIETDGDLFKVTTWWPLASASRE